VQKPKVALTLAASGGCNDTLHDELVSSVNSTVVGQAPAKVQDNIMVNKGLCTNVSKQCFALQHLTLLLSVGQGLGCVDWQSTVAGVQQLLRDKITRDITHFGDC
jgi:hypothetical protein